MSRCAGNSRAVNRHLFVFAVSRCVRLRRSGLVRAAVAAAIRCDNAACASMMPAASPGARLPFHLSLLSGYGSQYMYACGLMDTSPVRVPDSPDVPITPL